MSDPNCTACRRPKATVSCERCGDWNCKSCAHHLDEARFSFRSDLPAELQLLRYCQSCFQQIVEPAIEEYESWMEQARDVFIFFTTQRKPVPVLTKAQEKVRVDQCPDRDETILRLAFQAVRLGCNAVVDTEILGEKIRNAGYQKTVWKGSGFPARVDAERMERGY